MGEVIGVVGGHGGVGASLFSACLSLASADTVLVDLDPLGGGLDVALGIEAVPGVRWSGLFADGGRFDPDELAEALPRWGTVPVVACDRATVPQPRVVTAVLDAVPGTAVVDLGRGSSPTRCSVAARCDRVVVLVGTSVPAVSAAGAVLAGLELRPDRVRLVVRTGDGPLSPRRVSEALGLASCGLWPGDRVLARAGHGGLDASAVRPSLRRTARSVVATSHRLGVAA